MLNHSEPIEAGTRFRSLLTGATYSITHDYDPQDIMSSATITLAMVDYDGRNMHNIIIHVAADRIDVDFKLIP